MNTDPFGITYFLSSEVCELLYQNPDLKLANVVVSDPEEYNSSVKQTYSEFDLLPKYTPQVGISVEEFDKENQRNWLMPNEYKEFDIAEWVLNQCNNEDEIKRCGQELLLFQEKGTFDLLRYTKYLVDTFRKNNVVWGVGRGSSVASFVLFKIGIHKVDSLKFALPIEEFFK